MPKNQWLLMLQHSRQNWHGDPQFLSSCAMPQPLSGQRINPQKYGQRPEHWGVQGTARACLGADTFELTVSQRCDMAPGRVHRLNNVGSAPLGIIEVQFGANLGKTDIARPGDDGGRA